MIRSFLLAAGFLAVTVSLLFLQPAPRDGLDGDYSAPEVTRSDTSPTPSLLGPQETSSRETSRVADVQADTRSERAMPLPSGTGTGDDQIAVMTRNIVDALRAPAGAPLPDLAAAPAPQPIIAAPEPAQDGEPRRPVAAGIQQDLQRSAAQGASDFELVQMVEDAVAQGLVDARPEHMTPMGAIDHGALLGSLLPGRVPAPRSAITQPFVYRIQPNDSLAGLAALFYGDPTQYTEILAANSDLLSAPDQIKAGMLLNMPASIQ